MVQKEERIIPPYQGKDTQEQEEIKTLRNELANTKKNLMEARKILNNLESNYEELEVKYDNIDGAMIETKRESYIWKDKYKGAQVAFQEAMILQKQMQQREKSLKIKFEYSL